MSTNFPQVPANITWSLNRNHAENISIGNVVTRVSRTGDTWSISATIPPLQGDDFRAFRSAHREASMLDGFFAVPDHSYTAKYDGWNGLVNGGSQTGGSLLLRDLQAGKTVSAGDRVWLLNTGQVVEVRADAVVSASGTVTLSIDPPLRASPTDISSAILDTPLVAMRTGDMSYMVQAPITASVTVGCVEWIGKKATLDPGIILDGTYVSPAVTFTRASGKTSLNQAGTLVTSADNIWIPEYK